MKKLFQLLIILSLASSCNLENTKQNNEDYKNSTITYLIGAYGNDLNDKTFYFDPDSIKVTALEHSKQLCGKFRLDTGQLHFDDYSMDYFGVVNLDTSFLSKWNIDSTVNVDLSRFSKTLVLSERNWCTSDGDFYSAYRAENASVSGYCQPLVNWTKKKLLFGQAISVANFKLYRVCQVDFSGDTVIKDFDNVILYELVSIDENRLLDPSEAKPEDVVKESTIKGIIRAKFRI